MASSTTRTARSCEWTFTDHLGTPLLQTNSSKAVVWRAEYEPYGNVYAMRTGTKDDQPLRFPGQERLFDGATGTEERYNIFRYYRSGWGRYTQSDPLFHYDSRDAHEYVYVEANPIRRFDPVGLFEIEKSCDGLDCKAAFNPQQTTRTQVYEETRGLCRTLDSLITNHALRRCITRSCEKGRIKCTDPFGGCADNSTWGAYSVSGSLLKPTRNVFLCTSNWGKGKVVPGELGDMVIHEWAHGCGWNHGDGGGVPRDPGKRGGGR